MALANAVPQFEARTLLVAAFLITGLALTATVWQDREVPILLPVAVALAVILYVSDRLSVPTVREDSAALLLSYAALTIAVLVRRRTWLCMLALAVPVLWAELQLPIGAQTVSALGPATATAAACLLALPVIEQMADRITQSARRRPSRNPGARRRSRRGAPRPAHPRPCRRVHPASPQLHAPASRGPRPCRGHG